MHLYSQLFVLNITSLILGIMRILFASYVSTLCLFASSESPKHLRAPDIAQQPHQNPRQHVIRRIYGDDNALVRNEMNKIELRMSRYKTGFNADPNHIVPYENHPYDPLTRRRRLDDAEDLAYNSTDAQGSATYKPMRIRFETKALDDIRDSSNAAKIDWFKTEILPVTADFWSSALSVVPVSGNLRISSGELDSFAYCGDSEFTEVPNEHKSTGVENTDLILYVSGSASERFCPERTLAVAVPCNFDQFDRPTAGAINVCLNGIVLNSDGTSTPDVVQDYIDVTIHEVAHVLGHSSNSYRFFWDSETGTERTARPFSETTVTCVDGVERTLVLPDTNTMEIGIDDRGRRFATIVTPKVRAIARNQFNCQSLTGANLENQPTRADSCVGDHWDERLFYPEALSGVISPTSNILYVNMLKMCTFALNFYLPWYAHYFFLYRSSLTLALMEDSGWYLANYTNSRMSPWGLGAGCDFANEFCLTVNDAGVTTVPAYSDGFFCSVGASKGCSSEHSHKLACTVLDYNYYSPVVLPDTIYQYFPTEPSKGGPRQADFCPVFGTTYDNLNINDLRCTKTANTPTLNVYR
jgi:hypothetical protein